MIESDDLDFDLPLQKKCNSGNKETSRVILGTKGQTRWRKVVLPQGVCQFR